METTQETNIVTTALAKSSLKEETKIQLMNHFGKFEDQIAEWEGQAFGIVVTDVTQKDIINQAKEGAKFLQGVRISIEKLHKELKAEVLPYGQLLDLIKRELTRKIEPLETHLDAQADFVKNQEKKYKSELRASRLEAMKPYRMEGDGYDNFPLEDMAESAFRTHLNGLQVAHEQREAEKAEIARVKVENERIAAEERERILAENERLRIAQEKEQRIKNRITALMNIGFKFSEERDRFECELKPGLVFHYEECELRSLSLEDFTRQYSELKKTFNDYQEEQNQVRAKENQERERIERENRERIQREELAKKEQANAERRARRQPDKVKLIQFADDIDKMECLKLSDNDAQEILNNAKTLLGKVSAYIRKNSENL